MSWQNFNWIDYIFLGIIAFSALISLIRGFVREALSLIIWIAAVWVAYRFAPMFVARFLMGIENESIRLPLAIVSLFISVLIVGAIISAVMGGLVAKTGLSGTDRVLGLVFGIARGVLLIAVIVLIVPMTAAVKNEEWQNAQLVPQFEGLAAWLKTILPGKFDQLAFPKSATEQENVPAATPNSAAPMSKPDHPVPVTPVNSPKT